MHEIEIAKVPTPKLNTDSRPAAKKECSGGFRYVPTLKANGKTNGS